MNKLVVENAVRERFPQAHVMVLYASNISNSPSNDASRALQKETIANLLEHFAYEKTSDHPHIAAWREVFSAFGAKPKKYQCSAEALIKRTLKDEELPEINYLVDIYNCLSIKHVIPFGGENRDALASDLVLKFADGSEEFLTRSGDNEPPEEGEVVWADSESVVCRRWNWRQGSRTALTEGTTNAYFVIEALEPYTLEHIQSAADELESYIRECSPDAEFEREILT